LLCRRNRVGRNLDSLPIVAEPRPLVAAPRWVYPYGSRITEEPSHAGHPHLFAEPVAVRGARARFGRHDIGRAAESGAGSRCGHGRDGAFAADGGTWDVRQRMWPGAGAPVVDLPPAVVERHLVGGAFLEETMQLAPGSKQPPFTRTAYFNYNAVTHRYEYASMDTRALQLMVEKSAAPYGNTDGTIVLQGGRFLARKWGVATNVTFRYRLWIGPVEHDRQTVRLYLTPLSGAAGKEFLAFEYVYARRRA